MSKLTGCLIGCGGIGRVHAKALSGLSEQVEFYASDVSVEAAEGVAEEFAAKGVIADGDEAFERCDIDFVDLCIPHDLHLDAVRRAAAAEKAILLEKPIGRTVRESDAILDAVAEAGVRFFVAECWHFWPHVIEARKLLDAGAIGDVFLIRANTLGYHHPPGWRRSKERNGGGVLIDRGIHFVDVLWHLGGRIETVFAQSAHRSIMDMEGEDTALLQVVFESGVAGDLLCAWGCYPAADLPWFTVYGNEGTLEMGDGLHLIRSARKEKTDECILPGMTHDWEMVDLTVQHFVNCLVSGDAFGLDPEVTRDEVAVVCAAHESFETRQAVRVEY